MGELQDMTAVFSNWVNAPLALDGGSHKTSGDFWRTARPSYTDEEFRQAVQSWLQKPASGVRTLKTFTRQGVRPQLRKEFWLAASGGKNVQHGFRKAKEHMGIQIPSRIPQSIFGGSKPVPRYFLNNEGQHVILEILFVLSCVHPDLQYCPLLPPLAAMFLHFMDEEECFTCMAAILDSRNALLDQSQTAVAVTAKSFQDFLKDRMVHVVDNFLIQGPKVFIRTGLIIFNQFSKSLAKQGHPVDMSVLFKTFVTSSAMLVQGPDLIEAAFNIRGLSWKQLEKLKRKNMALVKEGKLDVPRQPQSQLPSLAVFAVKDSDLLSLDQWETLHSWLPERLQIKRPVCIFSTQRDGCSIKTLYNKCDEEADTVLLVKTADQEVFGTCSNLSRILQIVGALLTSPWSERTSGPKSLSFFGTGESLVFSLLPRRVRYAWTQQLDYFMAGDDTCLQVGGGGDSALWLDAELSRGHSGRSDTFGNAQLTGRPDFLCVRADVLRFVSEYRSDNGQ